MRAHVIKSTLNELDTGLTEQEFTSLNDPNYIAQLSRDEYTKHKNALVKLLTETIPAATFCGYCVKKKDHEDRDSELSVNYHLEFWGLGASDEYMHNGNAWQVYYDLYIKLLTNVNPAILEHETTDIAHVKAEALRIREVIKEVNKDWTRSADPHPRYEQMNVMMQELEKVGQTLSLKVQEIAERDSITMSEDTSRQEIKLYDLEAKFRKMLKNHESFDRLGIENAFVKMNMTPEMENELRAASEAFSDDVNIAILFLEFPELMEALAMDLRNLSEREKLEAEDMSLRSTIAANEEARRQEVEKVGQRLSSKKLEAKEMSMRDTIAGEEEQKISAIADSFRFFQSSPTSSLSSNSTTFEVIYTSNFNAESTAVFTENASTQTDLTVTSGSMSPTVTVSNPVVSNIFASETSMTLVSPFDLDDELQGLRPISPCSPN